MGARIQGFGRAYGPICMRRLLSCSKQRKRPVRVAFFRVSLSKLNSKHRSVRAIDLDAKELSLPSLLRKEVIQPQVPLRLPCYDFTPVTDHSLGGCPPCGLAHRLLEQSTPMV